MQWYHALFPQQFVRVCMFLFAKSLNTNVCIKCLHQCRDVMCVDLMIKKYRICATGCRVKGVHIKLLYGFPTASIGYQKSHATGNKVTKHQISRPQNKDLFCWWFVWFVMVVHFAHMVVLFHEGRVWRKALQPLYIQPSTGASARDGRGINKVEIKKKPSEQLVPCFSCGVNAFSWWDLFWLPRAGGCSFNPRWLGGGEGEGASLEGSGEQGGGISTRQGIQHTVGGIQASHAHQRRHRRLRISWPAGRGYKLIWKTENSSQPSKAPSKLNSFLPKRSVKMTGDEKAAAVEKSQLVPVEKSQEEEKKPNAAPTEWEMFGFTYIDKAPGLTVSE